MRTLRILFVEDDPEMSSVYQEIFFQPEFETAIAANGKIALEMLRSGNKFDVVVSDQSMPGMDGITMLKNIRNEFPELLVIMVTGYGNWSDYLDGQKFGCVKFINKPIKMSALRKLILNANISR